MGKGKSCRQSHSFTHSAETHTHQLELSGCAGSHYCVPTSRLEKIVIIKLVLFVLRFGQRLVLFYSVEKDLIL